MQTCGLLGWQPCTQPWPEGLGWPMKLATACSCCWQEILHKFASFAMLVLVSPWHTNCIPPPSALPSANFDVLECKHCLVMLCPKCCLSNSSWMCCNASYPSVICFMSSGFSVISLHLQQHHVQNKPFQGAKTGLAHT